MDTGQRTGLRRCPNCLGLRFFVEPQQGLVFLNVRADGTAQATKPPHAPLKGPDNTELDLSNLHCTGCGWRGHADELLPPERAHG